MDDEKDENITEESTGINEATIQERSEPNPKRKGMLFSMLLIGVFIGVLIMFFIYQNQSEEIEPKIETNQNESLNVDITTQITEIVENVTPAVVGITNMQQQPEDFWREDQTLDDEAGDRFRCYL